MTKSASIRTARHPVYANQDKTMLIGEDLRLEVLTLLRFVAVQIAFVHVQVPWLPIEEKEVSVRLGSI